MKIAFENGCLADFPPVQPTPFVVYSENLRWRLGQPETIDLFSLLRDDGGTAIQLALPSTSSVTVFQDRFETLVGSGDKIWFIDITGKTATMITAASPSTGRWWFTGTEDYIIGARAATDNRIKVIDRVTHAVQNLPNAPDGAIAGGVSNGVLVLAGVESVAGAPAGLTVRWSARRTDPSSSGTPEGPFGFEDWTPSDINASGELLLDSGSVIVGGGATTHGFAVWTDQSMHMLTPRQDLYTFSETPVGARGLLATSAWCEMDGLLYWYDPTIGLNVYDGGSIRPIPNPMRMASVEFMDLTKLNRVVLVDLPQYHEVVLFYIDIWGQTRQLAYNTVENAWYPFRLDRVAMAGREGARPALAVTREGYLHVHRPQEWLDPTYLRPELSAGPPAPPQAEDVVPFHYYLMTSLITHDEPQGAGLRTFNAMLNHNYAGLRGASSDAIHMTVESFDTPARNAIVVHADRQSFPVGSDGADFRGGGRAMRVHVFSPANATFLRFGILSLDAEEGARR